MEKLKLELKARNRNYGILTWKLSQDFEVKTLLGNAKKVTIEYADSLYSDRKVDYKYRRIAFGKKRMEKISKDYVILTMVKGNLVIN